VESLAGCKNLAGEIRCPHSERHVLSADLRSQEISQKSAAAMIVDLRSCSPPDWKDAVALRCIPAIWDLTALGNLRMRPLACVPIEPVAACLRYVPAFPCDASCRMHPFPPRVLETVGVPPEMHPFVCIPPSPLYWKPPVFCRDASSRMVGTKAVTKLCLVISVSNYYWIAPQTQTSTLRLEQTSLQVRCLVEVAIWSHPRLI
jgi:hypothetical protein